MNTLIIERANEGYCPICKKEMSTEYVEVEFNGHLIKVCKIHVKGNADAQTV